MKTYKALAILLSYPSKDWVGEVDELISVLREEPLLAPKYMSGLEQLAHYIAENNLDDVQEHYSNLFDNNRAHCLNLFEHVYGESRDRGQAMVELLEHYRGVGLECSSKELPDYLPMYLEYLAQLSPKEALDNLNNIISLVAIINTRLQRQQTPYSAVFAALTHISNARLNTKDIQQAADAVRFKRNLKELDEEWEEAHAFDNSAICSSGTTAHNASGDGIRVAVPQSSFISKTGGMA